MLSTVKKAQQFSQIVSKQSLSSTKTILVKAPTNALAERTIIFQIAEKYMKKYIGLGDKMDYKLDRHNELKIRFDYRQGPTDDLDDPRAWHFTNQGGINALPLPENPYIGVPIMIAYFTIGLGIPVFACYWQNKSD